MPAVDIPCSLFSGLNTEMAPADLPEGVSPDNADVAYLPGSVFSRPGLHKLWPNPNIGQPTITYLKTFTLPTGGLLTLTLDSAGNLWKEDVSNSPGVLVQIGTVAAGSYASSVTAAGKEWIAVHDGLRGADIPLQFDGTNLDRVSQDGVGAAPTVAESAAAGSISAGVHKVVVMFLTRQGYLTKPSPVAQWTATGNKKVTLSNIPIGPPNVVARVFGFTAAGGGNYFAIEANVSQPTAIAATVIFDNTTQGPVDLDFSDNALLAATAIDITGNNLFAQEVLGPSAGVFPFASRMFWFGERNKVQNLLNMGFEGGTLVPPSGISYPIGTAPLGWSYITFGTNTGTLFVGAPNRDFGVAWGINGDGSANPCGQLQQSGYQDNLGVPILEPLKNYAFRCWMLTDNNAAPGVLACQIGSASTGFNAQVTIAINSLPSSGRGVFVQGNLNNPMPNPIPADMTIQIFAQNQTAGQLIVIDELEIIDATLPFLNNEFRGSYVDNLEAFDGVTGVIGSTEDPTAVRSLFEIRSTLYILTAERLHETSDAALGEPADWAVNQVAAGCGGLSARSVAGGGRLPSGGEAWEIWASTTGLRIFEGGFPYKISQEIQTLWDGINTASQQSVWALNDNNTKRCYIGVPMGTTTFTPSNGGPVTGTATAPNVMLVLDYRESDTASEVAAHTPIHISFTGKMIASDLGRKWTIWHLPMNCGAVLTRPNNVLQFCTGSGNGFVPNGGVLGTGNAYFFDPAKLTDDDYGAFLPYYTTYLFINHEAELALGVGTYLKRNTYLTCFVSGVGLLNITPYADSLTNPWPGPPAVTLTSAPKADFQLGMNVQGERIAFKFAPSPLPLGQAGYTNGTDVQFNLQKMVARLEPDAMAPLPGCL
jgi:hypothetical protein